MAKYILKRALAAIVTLFVLITVVFFLVRLIPGDPFNDPKLTDTVRENLYEYYGFDKPLVVQYGMYMNNLLHGDLGPSTRYMNRTVNDMIFESFPYSADL